MNMRLSASCIRCFKACPMRFYIQYVLGLVPVVEPDHFRMGTNYHFLQQLCSMKPEGPCICTEENAPYVTDQCPICLATAVLPTDPMETVVRHLNRQYAVPPIGKTVDEWETERTILLYSILGYRWWYNDTGYEVEHLEQRFRMPLISPKTGHSLRADLVGIIDRVFCAGGNRFVHEYKSTSDSLDPDSDIWKKLPLDTQTRMYTYAANRLDMGTCGVLYDVWHKPRTRPKKLTQGETKKFLADGLYQGEVFNTQGTHIDVGAGTYDVRVNNIPAAVFPGAKAGTLAIRETQEMYGARLMSDITADPNKHFFRKEVAHRQASIDAFQWDMFNMYKTIRNMKSNNAWWCNEGQCDATYKCQYTDFCYNHVVPGPDEVPAGYKKIPTSI